jgi:hypothetical protein
MSSLLFSQRSVSFVHGTGAQIHYLLCEYPSVRPLNYGYRDPGYVDQAVHIEAFWHRIWPFRSRGRGLLDRISGHLPYAVWRDHHLTRYGVRKVKNLLSAYADASHCIVFIHDENCATRFNSIRSLITLPYIIVLYDLMHLEKPIPDNLPAVSDCVSNALATYAISEPLRQAAKDLGAMDVRPIGFYRPKNDSVSWAINKSSTSGVLRILVMADAKRETFLELISAVKCVSEKEIDQKIEIHFVGNYRDFPSLCADSGVDIRFYGFVDTESRDRIASSCDIAYLAGSTEPPDQCPLAKYSIPSKIGDFAALGLPFIGRVSVGSAAHDMISSEMKGFAYVAISKTEVKEALILAANNSSLRNEMSRLASEYANTNLYLPNATTDELAFFGNQAVR